MKVCLDTNGYSALTQGDAAVVACLETAEAIIVPAAVVGELMYGFLKGNRQAANEAQLSDFLNSEGVVFHPVTRGIAERYGYVKAALRKKGTPIPENDLWIAATALETGARLLSYDGHFDQVGGLLKVSPCENGVK